MMIPIPIIWVFALLTINLPLRSQPQDQWAEANSKTTRLAPEIFKQLPQPVSAYLRTHKCRIPQTWLQPKPHNVIQGAFIRQGQNDWAVLCSNGAKSSILIFPNGVTKSVLKIAEAEDQGYLQTVDGKGAIGFSRAIKVADKQYILSHHKAYGGPKPPPITHHGIDDIFMEKASTIHYYRRGRWLQLQGAD